MASLSLQCLMAAAVAYHVSVPALQAIRTVEGGQEGQEVCQNADGSCDLGPFQVNDRAWVDTLARSLHADRQTVRATLRDDGCWNAQVASWILHQEMTANRGDEQGAIGDYHSHFRSAHDHYLRKVDYVLQSLSPNDAPPAMPGVAPGEQPGALRIPPDVTGDVPLPGLGQAADQKGKMIRVPKPHTTAPASGDPADADAAPSDSDAKPAPAPHVYRGVGGGGAG